MRGWRRDGLRPTTITATPDAAFSCVCSLPTSRPSATAVKHGSPCGAAFGASASEACERALGADSESVFGGVAAINRPLDVACAEAFDVDFS